MKNIIFLILTFTFSVSAFPQDADAINSAIAQGDLETLYNFIQESEGKPQALISSATQAIRRYTVTDTAAAAYRTNKMDTRVRSVPKDLTENLFLDPASYLPSVVSRLTSGVTNQFMKAKIIHDWICDNIAYDADHYFGRAYNRQDYVSVIKNKKGVCSGYADLFSEMCRLASVECITISGYSRQIIPMLDELVQSKRITEREKEHLTNSYYKIDYNGYYYYLEDQFDTNRNNAVMEMEITQGINEIVIWGTRASSSIGLIKYTVK